MPQLHTLTAILPSNNLDITENPDETLARIGWPTRSVPVAAIEIALESRPLTQGQSKAILALWMPVHLAGNSFAAPCLARALEGCFAAYAPPQIWPRQTLDPLTADDSAGPEPMFPFLVSA